MSGFKFTPPSLDGLPRKPLSDKTLAELVTSQVGYDGNPSLGKITFAFDASARGLIRVCNSADDEAQDKGDEVLGLPPKEEKDDALSPALTFSEESAWLKYRFEGAVKGSVGAKFPAQTGSVEPKIDASKGVVFAYYRRHRPADDAALAVADDAKQLLDAIRADDAVGLPEGDALLYRVYGELSASLTLKWSDVFTSGLSSLSALLRAGQVIALKVEAGAEVSFHVGVKDDYRLVFTKGGRVGDAAETVRVSVFKAKSREFGAGAKAGVSVAFADEKAVDDALANVYKQLAGPLVGDVDALMAEVKKAASLEALPEQFRGPAKLLMSRLGLDPLTDGLDKLGEKWEEVKGEVPKRIKEVAKAKAELGFTYEYLRVKTDQTLLRADLDPETFRRFHPDLMVCDLEGVTDWLREHPEALKKYLRQKSVKVVKLWGFGFGLSPWGVKVGGTDKLEKTKVVQENIERKQRVAYDGTRTYQSQWVKDTAVFAVDFKADMKNFSAGAAPLTCEFDYGLGLSWEWAEKTLGRDEYVEYLDIAQLWRAVPSARVEEALKAVEGKFGQRAKVKLELTADHDALVRLLPLLVNPPAPPFNPPDGYATFDADRKLETWGAESLAAAMPYLKDFDGRSNPVARQHLYAPLWRRYFREDTRPFGDWNTIARLDLPRIAQELNLGLKKVDEFANSVEAVPAQRLATFAGMIELQHGPADSSAGVHHNWQRFAGGLKTLEAVARPGNCLPEELIERSFDGMAHFFDRPLYLRALGFFVSEVARLNGILRLLKRSFTVTYGEGDDEEAITIG